MLLTRTIKVQLVVFVVIALVSATAMFFDYMRIPTTFFGIDAACCSSRLSGCARLSMNKVAYLLR